MTLDEAIDRACADVGITPPKGRIDIGKWINADTLGKHGKGDGRIIADEERVTAFNWQTGDKATVWLKGRENITPADRQKYARQMAETERKARERAAHAAMVATSIVTASTVGTHPYLAGKGFPAEPALVIGRDALINILVANRKRVDSMVTDGRSALVVPARLGRDVRSVQIIWEDGAKKFLAGGEMGGAHHRISSGRDTWLCEGYATGLSLRAALKGLGRSDTVLVCFSAANIVKVAKDVRGRCYVAADHDAPPDADQFNGLGTGEHYARLAGRPYIMPPDVKTDVNDFHMAAGIFAVQRLVTDVLRRAA